MDVQRIQKINSMAVELHRRGLASTRDEAVRQAEQMFKDQDDGGFAGVMNTLEQVRAEQKQANSRTQEGSADLSHEKVSEILQKNTQFLVKTIKDFTERVDVLEKEISRMQTSLARQQLPTVGEVLTKAREEQQATVKSPGEEPRGRKSSEPTGPHPRQGNYKSEDVSIEKMFYMGHK